MNTWKVILATLVIFVTGVITGGLLVEHFGNVLPHAEKPVTVAISRHSVSNSAATGRSVRPLLAPNFLQRKDFLERLDRELKLNAEQREHIEKIISEGQERIKSLCQEIEPDVKEELADTREKIRLELTAEQQTLFTELLKRRPAVAKPATNSPAMSTNPPANKGK